MGNKKILFLTIFLLLFSLPLPAFGFECGESLFPENSLSPQIQTAQEQFEQLTDSFTPDTNVDIIFEVPIESKSVMEIEQIITDGQSNYFIVATQDSLENHPDCFSQRYESVDGEWTKTIKVSTQNFKGQPIIPYIQIFYEDQYGGVIRLKPYGNPAAPAHLVHLQAPHGTLYFKQDPDGALSWENEAFKVYGFQALPKSPGAVDFPPGVELGSPEGEAFLNQCWTFRTHVPLSR